MSPERRKKQDNCVAETMKKNSATSCPVGYIWLPDVDKGYRCLGGNHFTTHELIFEGLNRYYTGNCRYDFGNGVYSHTSPLRGPFRGCDPSYANETDEDLREFRIAQFGVPEPTANMVRWTSGADGVANIEARGALKAVFQDYVPVYAQGYFPDLSGYSGTYMPDYLQGFPRGHYQGYGRRR